ncbi:MAG: pyridoxal phosphate-dependent aminotransferase [Clostridia bacterium]|nr:pyridoxal phosphate-dependent aminotransferase [Clostridia bacterium]
MLSLKAQSMTPSMTLGISTKVKEMKAQGIEITNLSIGEPDFYTPKNAKTAAEIAIKNNKTKYDAAAGLLELRKALSKKLLAENNLMYSPEEIVVSNGGKHAITNTLIALVDPGQEVIIPKPYWVSYPEMVKLTGGVPVLVDTKKENNFKITKDELKAAITDKTKAIFITNPSNPTGAVYTKEELTEIVDVCVENKIYILADELYERICYLDEFTSVASISDAAKEYTVTINGFSKSAAMTGWRLGYTATTKELAKAISGIQGHLVSHPCTIAQWAAVEVLNSCEGDMQKMVAAYRARRDEAVALFEEIPGLSLVQPDGAFYLFVDMSSIKDKLHYSDSFSMEVCNKLLEDHQLAVVPGVAFGNDDFIRISYAADINDIKAGIEKIKNFVSGFNL